MISIVLNTCSSPFSSLPWDIVKLTFSFLCIYFHFSLVLYYILHLVAHKKDDFVEALLNGQCRSLLITLNI